MVRIVAAIWRNLVLQRRRDTGTLATLFWGILVAKGTFTAGQFDEIMSVVDGEEDALFVKGEKD